MNLPNKNLDQRVSFRVSKEKYSKFKIKLIIDSGDMSFSEWMRRKMEEDLK